MRSVLTPLLVTACVVAAAPGFPAPEGKSLLKWAPGGASGPARPQVTVEPLKGNDLGLDRGRLHQFSAHSSVLDVFTGRRQALLKAFREQFSVYRNQRQFPRMEQPDDPNITVATYLLPYEYDQHLFLGWMEEQGHHADFFSPRARKWNPYLGPAVSPLTQTQPTEEFLQRSLGRAVVQEGGALTFIVDNRYNPSRWMSPLNEIHHHEQPALCMTIDLAEAERPAAKAALSNRMAGEVGSRLLLHYDVTLRLDFHEDMGEETAFDFYEGQDPSESFMTGRSHANALRAIAGGDNSPEPELHPARRLQLDSFVRTRVEPANFQLSLMVLFEPRYQLAEFMLAEYQQEPCDYPPPAPGEIGFLAVDNPTMAAEVRDGGNPGSHAWWRIPISMFDNPAFTDNGRFASPILSGGEYLDLEEPLDTEKRLAGVLDITEFYAASRATGVFPGQRGYWVDRWVGFDGEAEEYRNPGVVHGLQWAGIIVEASGAMRVELEIHRFDLRIQSN